MDYISYANAKAEGYSRAAGDLTASLIELRGTVDKLRDDPQVNAAVAARVLFVLKEAYAQLDAATKQLYAIRDLLDKTIVPTKMDAEGVDMVRVPEIARSFSKQNKMSASLIDKEKGFEWLRSIGQGDIIQETVNAGTLAAFVRNMIIEEGVDPPEDVVKVNTYNTTGINRYTPK